MSNEFLEEFKQKFINKVERNRIEIERKFLVKSLPDYLWKFNHYNIEQHYISFEPEVRIRKSGKWCMLTFKGEGSLERDEVEIPITVQKFEDLKEMSSGSIYKTRYIIENEDHDFELDVYHNVDSLITAEVEFDDKADEESFCKPGWLGTDVTFLSEFKNKNLARKGFPRALSCIACEDGKVSNCELCKGKGGLKITHVDLEAYNEERGNKING